VKDKEIVGENIVRLRSMAVTCMEKTLWSLVVYICFV